jgi:hypothetical protein
VKIFLCCSPQSTDHTNKFDRTRKATNPSVSFIFIDPTGCTFHPFGYQGGHESHSNSFLQFPAASFWLRPGSKEKKLLMLLLIGWVHGRPKKQFRFSLSVTRVARVAKWTTAAT